MRRFLMGFIFWLAPTLVLAQGVQFELQGGPQLTIRAKAQQQQWVLLDGRILLAAVIEGRLVVQEFAWPPGPGPGPGPDPKPDPKPDPQPVKQWQIVICVESDRLDNLTPTQQSLLASLLVRKDLEARGHRLVGVFDPDAAKTATDPALQAWIAAVRGKAPCLAIAPLGGGTIRVFPLPADINALMRLLENPPQEKQSPSCNAGQCVR